METEDHSTNQTMQTFTAVLIALVVVIGAIVAWRASLAEDAAGDADYAGLRAAINAEEALALNSINAYQSYETYISYWNNNLRAHLISQEIEKDPQNPDNETLAVEMKTAYDLADSARSMFEARFLNRDGTYNLQRQLGEMWADSSREKDLNYEEQFAEAEKMRSKTVRLLSAVMVLSIAPVFYSLVETVAGRTKYVMLALGSVFAIAGTIVAALVEFGKW